MELFKLLPTDLKDHSSIPSKIIIIVRRYIRNVSVTIIPVYNWSWNFSMLDNEAGTWNYKKNFLSAYSLVLVTVQSATFLEIFRKSTVLGEYDWAVWEDTIFSRRRRRGRFSASISRGTCLPFHPANAASRSRLGTYTKSISLDLGRRRRVRGM